VTRTRKYVFLPLAVISVVAIVAVWWMALGRDSVFGDRVRWTTQSRHYKARVLARPETNGELKHVEWNNWGWGGEDTAVYLAFDPTDSLSDAASRRQPGKYRGIPCEVFIVHRLESHWYTIQFYTDHYWQPNC
jgi:hypothetical protein